MNRESEMKKYSEQTKRLSDTLRNCSYYPEWIEKNRINKEKGLPLENWTPLLKSIDNDAERKNECIVSV